MKYYIENDSDYGKAKPKKPHKWAKKEKWIDTYRWYVEIDTLAQLDILCEDLQCLVEYTSWKLIVRDYPEDK